MTPEELDALSRPPELTYDPILDEPFSDDDDLPPDLEAARVGPVRDQLDAVMRNGKAMWARSLPRQAGEPAGLLDLIEIDRHPPEPLLLGRLDPVGHTVLFGPGGVGKGTLATHWAVQLQRAGKGVLILDYENHPEEWARRYFGLGGGDDAKGSGVLHYAPLTQRETAKPIWDNREFIDGLLIDYAIGLIIVDSIVMACGGADPMDPGVAARYAGALQGFARWQNHADVPVPVLSLGHVTKADDLRYPFGSVFFHNTARVTWSLERSGESTILTNRKANNYQAPGKTLVTTTWMDDLPREIWEQPYAKVLGDRIADVLGDDEALTVAQITTRLADEVDEDGKPPKADSVRAALRRGLRATPKRYTVVGSGSSATWRTVPE